MSRDRDYAYEALAESTSTDMAAGRGVLNAALKSIREQSEIEDSYLLADEIHTRAKLYRQVFPDAALTPNALAKHWLRVFEEVQARKVAGTNRHAESECATCGGDLFVLYALRKPVQTIWMKEHGISPSDDMVEEMASCPDCGPDLQAVRRPDGSMFVPPDPGAVRQRL